MTTKTALKKVPAEDRARIECALAFYIDRCNWTAEPEEREEYQRVLDSMNR